MDLKTGRLHQASFSRIKILQHEAGTILSAKLNLMLIKTDDLRNLFDSIVFHQHLISQGERADLFLDI
jgi:hypothetical protein